MPREIKAPEPTITTSLSFDSKHKIEFNEISHRYRLFPNGAKKGFQTTGVTTFQKSSYPTSMGLITWMREETAKWLFEQVTVPGEGGLYPREGFWPVSKEVQLDLIKAAKKADRGTAQEAADIGTITHGFAELHSLGKVAEANALLEQVKDVAAWPMIESCIKKYLEWATINRGTPVMAENVCAYVCIRHYNPDEFIIPLVDGCSCYCGKFDRLDMVDGKLRLRDYKTSKDIFLEQFVQLAAYVVAIKAWFNLDVKEVEVLRFGKNDGTFDTFTSHQLAEQAGMSDDEVMYVLQSQAMRCRETYEFRKLENIDRFKWKGATK